MAGLLSPPSPDPRLILTSIGEVLYDWDLGSDHLIWGPNVADLIGFASAETLATGRGYANLMTPGSTSSRYDAITRAQDADQGNGVTYHACYALAPSGSERPLPVWVEDTGRWFAGPEGKPARAHGLIRIVTERHEAEQRLSARSHLDPSTGALNRIYLSEHIARLIEEGKGGTDNFVVLLAAIENLFALNRTYGYDVADQVIAGIVARLRAQMRATDVIARHAGNKFALVLESCDGEQMKVAALRLLQATAATPFETSAGPVHANLRIGGVAAPRHGRSPPVLFQHAEEALDLSRQAGATRFTAFEASLAREDSRVRALRTAEDILGALNQGRIRLALQPVVRTSCGGVAFEEGLLRLIQPDNSIIAPAVLLPVAEKAGLVALLDRRVLELSLLRLSENPTSHIAVNVSAATLHDPDWPERLRSATGLYPGTAERLIVEITETSALVDIDATCAVIDAMKALGIRVAMDDFGAGHTSFKNLRRLGFDLVKLDGAFIQNLSRSPDDRFFVRTLLDLARHLEIEAVAEWVEDAETARLLTDWGVDYMQGVFFGEARLAQPLVEPAAA
ncbi:MAG: bifunctional diguanylate cyclase/phosphodiesterase [Beijerinckiaceae bacterium]